MTLFFKSSDLTGYGFHDVVWTRHGQRMFPCFPNQSRDVRGLLKEERRVSAKTSEKHGFDKSGWDILTEPSPSDVMIPFLLESELES